MKKRPPSPIYDLVRHVASVPHEYESHIPIPQQDRMLGDPDSPVVVHGDCLDSAGETKVDFLQVGLLRGPVQ